ncbi:MAG: rRNA maturation RNase YbeY [Amoebophilaceae bacterium]|jgi:rRNA maturation RNase YbeY|nr:rRNA maturation RNase YbeY [Amoebophilaceae bacterium]
MSKIRFFSEETRFVLPAPAETASWIQAVIQQEGYVLAHLNIIFCSDHYLLIQNRRYLQHDTLTDVLTFDYADQAGIIEGDIYISIDRVRDNAQTWQQSFTEELQTVIVHGVLHLLGYDDQAPEAKALMRQKETEYMAKRQGATTVADDSAHQAAHASQAGDKRNGEDIHPSSGLCNPD